MDRRTWSVQGINAVAVVGAAAIVFGLHAVLRGVTALPLELALGVGWALAFTAIAWGRMDEVARQAHKDAWFWGGSIALAFAVLALLVALSLDPNPGLLHRYSGHPVWLMLDGAVLVAAAMVLGYGLVWTCWWLKRR